MEKPCRNCGRCDACLGITAPDGMKVCRKCGETRPLAKFTRRADTGGYRNHCNTCRNVGMLRRKCEDCGEWFTTQNPDRVRCRQHRRRVEKDCPTCGERFTATIKNRAYCDDECRDAAIPGQRAARAAERRHEALVLYSAGDTPACACCDEQTEPFLTFEHINGGGRQHRLSTGGGGFITWLLAGRREGIEVLCMNCNHGRRVNGGVCPHLSAPTWS